MDNILKPIENAEQITPDWLKSLLSMHFGKLITNIRYECQTRREREGFLSEISYVSVSFNDGSKDRDLSLVFKFLPNDAGARQLAVDGNLAEREVSFYNFAKTEEFDMICHKNSVGNLVPKVYFAGSNESALTIVLQDMSIKNFRTILSRDGLNLKDSKEILSRISFIHAASLVYFKKKGSFGVKRYDDYSYLNQYFLPNLALMCEMYSKSPLGTLIEQIVPFATLIPALHLKDPVLETVIHGDLWSGQCMRSSNGEVCVLDWQFCTVATPIYDIMAFFFMSCKPVVLENDLMELLDCYWQQFTDVLEKSKVTCPVTFEGFVQSVENNWMSGFNLLVNCLKDFLGSGNITEQRISGLLSLLNKKNVFENFLKFANDSLNSTN